MILRFLALDGVDSYSPVRARQNKIEPLGKVRTPEGWIVDPTNEPARVVLSGDELHEDRQFLRKEVLRGHILVADEETAKLLEVPWDAKSVAGRQPVAVETIETLEGGVVGFVPPAAAPPSDPNAVLTPRADGDATPPADALAKRADTLPPPPPDSPAVTPAKAPARRKET